MFVKNSSHILNLRVQSPQRLHICFKPNRPKFCRPARIQTQKQVVGHDNRGNKPYVRRINNSKLILSSINP